MDQKRRPRTVCQKKLGAVGGPGRPTDLARGPHLLNQGRLPIDPLGRLQRFSPMAPYYKYKEGRE